MREVGRDGIGLPVGVYRDGFDPGVGEVVQRVVQQGAATEFQQGFRGGGGQRAHAGGEAGGQDHGGTRGDGHGWSPGLRLGGLPRAACGIHRFKAAWSGAAAGWESASSSSRQVRGP